MLEGDQHLDAAGVNRLVGVEGHREAACALAAGLPFHPDPGSAGRERRGPGVVGCDVHRHRPAAGCQFDCLLHPLVLVLPAILINGDAVSPGHSVIISFYPKQIEIHVAGTAPGIGILLDGDGDAGVALGAQRIRGVERRPFDRDQAPSAFRLHIEVEILRQVVAVHVRRVELIAARLLLHAVHLLVARRGTRKIDPAVSPIERAIIIERQGERRISAAGSGRHAHEIAVVADRPVRVAVHVRSEIAAQRGHVVEVVVSFHQLQDHAVLVDGDLGELHAGGRKDEIHGAVALAVIRVRRDGDGHLRLARVSGRRIHVHPGGGVRPPRRLGLHGELVGARSDREVQLIRFQADLGGNLRHGDRALGVGVVLDDHFSGTDLPGVVGRDGKRHPGAVETDVDPTVIISHLPVEVAAGGDRLGMGSAVEGEIILLQGHVRSSTALGDGHRAGIGPVAAVGIKSEDADAGIRPGVVFRGHGDRRRGRTRLRADVDPGRDVVDPPGRLLRGHRERYRSGCVRKLEASPVRMDIVGVEGHSDAVADRRALLAGGQAQHGACRQNNQ